jgi:hypothetical protein
MGLKNLPPLNFKLSPPLVPVQKPIQIFFGNLVSDTPSKKN